MNKILKKGNPVILIIFLSMVSFKIYTAYHGRGLNNYDDTCLFWTESAFHYRTSRMIAERGGIPKTDIMVQYPEGLDYNHKITILMQSVAGYLYRFLIPRTVPFHVYIVFFISICSSLIIFPLFFICKSIYGDYRVALFCTLLFSLSPALYMISINFRLIDFSLWLIFFHIFFFIKALRERDSESDEWLKKSYLYSLISGIFLAVSIMAWHLTQFYFLVFAGFIIIRYMFKKEQELIDLFLITSLFPLLTGIFIPVVRSGGFLISFAMLIVYSFFIVKFFPKRMDRRLSFITVLFIFISFILLTARTNISQYSHVWSLMLAKIRNLGVRPDNPANLSWEVLVEWVSPLNSPSLKEIMSSLGMLIPTGLAGIVIGIMRIRKKASDTGRLMLIYFTAVFIILYLMMVKMDIFLAFFLSAMTGELWKVRNRLYLYIILFVASGINGYLTFSQKRKLTGPNRNYLLNVVKYIRYNTDDESPVLTSFPFSPSIITYTGRPVILHSKFEDRGLRNKVKRFEHLLFKKEDDFFKFCREVKAEYFLYHTDILLSRRHNSIRYRTHNLTVNDECVAYKFQFNPENLKHFKLLHSNPQYRLFKIVSNKIKKDNKKHEYFRVYDRTLFNISEMGIEKE